MHMLNGSMWCIFAIPGQYGSFRQRGGGAPPPPPGPRPSLPWTPSPPPLDPSPPPWTPSPPPLDPPPHLDPLPPPLDPLPPPTWTPSLPPLDPLPPPPSAQAMPWGGGGQRQWGLLSGWLIVYREGQGLMMGGWVCLILARSWEKCRYRGGGGQRFWVGGWVAELGRPPMLFMR